MNWTNDDRKEWAALLATPFGQRWLNNVKDIVLTRPRLDTSPGYDMLVIGATAGYGFTAKIELIEQIVEMGREHKAPTPLPNEFERTPPPKKQP